ncbi:MAG: ABC transporter substrate-binding protein [Mycobacterium leprae]
MKKRLFALLAILLLAATLLSACSKSANDSSLDRVKQAGKLTVALEATYPPMESMDKDGKTVVGFDVDFAKALAEKLGVQAEFKTMDFDGLIPGLQAKRFDVIISFMNPDDTRRKQVDFIEYLKMGQVFVSRKGVNVKTEKDLAGKTVAVQAETTSQSYVEDLKAKKIKDIKEIRSFKMATDAFLELKNNRADVVIIDEPVGRYYAALDPATYAVTGQAISPQPVGIAVNKEDKALYAALEKALKDMKSDGTFGKISVQWFGNDVSK